MKKIALLFLIGAYMFSFYLAYLQTDNEQLDRINEIEQNIGREFVIPDIGGLQGSEEVYPILVETARQSKVNIFRKSIQFQEDDQIDILKYVLLTTNTRFFTDFHLKQGRFLSAQDMGKRDSYVSTIDSDEANQVGTIAEFGGNQVVKIESLQASYNYLPVHGTYYAEVPNRDELAAFIHLFVQKLNQYFKGYNLAFSDGDFLESQHSTELQAVSFRGLTILTYLSYVIYAMTILLLQYAILNESKKLGILKLHGVSRIRLWSIVAGKRITYTFISAILLSLVLAALIPDSTLSFLTNFLLYQFKAYLILIVMSLVVYVYISSIKVGRILKNVKDTTGIFILNFLMKIGCSVLIGLTGLSIWVQFTSIHEQRAELRNWESVKDYGVFYPVNNGYDGDRIFSSDSDFEHVSHNELYFLLNQTDSILIAALMYEEQELIDSKNWDGIRSVRVNPNYLKKFPLLDSNNNKVEISEKDSDWILLVPEKYRNREKEILKFFQWGRKEFREIDKQFYKKSIPGKIKNQKLRIVWMKNNQQVFSFNPNVFPSEHNNIVDPITEVLTENNSLYADRSAILGGGANDPLKVRLINRDPRLTYETLLPELKKLRVDDNLRHLVTIDQYMLEKINDQQNAIQESWLTLIALMAGLILLAVQNLVLFFNKYQSKFIVRRLFGIGFWRTYIEYWRLFLIAGVLQTLLCFVLNKGIDIPLLIVAAIILVIEMIASVIALIKIEKKNKMKVLKGGS
ncbi:bacteriocin-associated integral membrane family protein [Paenibacillus zanthoxyli]|uniref:bacteriocin-associated integral membrane family protein n=1 Tax=Paenibacillus zanthoxyli TaxID=369399 RepID=UPI00046FD88D|nr:DUF1430 domain-containing protein [Paenibacillus zanthoxyli]